MSSGFILSGYFHVTLISEIDLFEISVSFEYALSLKAAATRYPILQGDRYFVVIVSDFYKKLFSVQKMPLYMY